jgi:hypothetical protein
MEYYGRSMRHVHEILKYPYHIFPLPILIRLYRWKLRCEIRVIRSYSPPLSPFAPGSPLKAKNTVVPRPSFVSSHISPACFWMMR